MNAFLFLVFGVSGVFVLTLINPFLALPVFIFGHFVEPIQFFPELRQYNTQLILGCAVLGAWLLHIIFTGNFVAANNRLVAPVILFIGWTFICMKLGTRGAWYEQSMFLINIIPFFVFLYMINTRKQLISIIWVLLIMGVIASVYGLYCVRANIGVSDGGLVRITSFMSNPNAFGKTLAFLIPISICLILSKYHFFVKLILAFVVFMMITGVVISYSRTSMIAMLLSLIITPMMYYKGSKKLVAFLITLLIMPLLYYGFPLDRVKWKAHNRLVSIFEAESAAEVDLGRVETAKAGWIMMRENPVFGVGIGGFGHEYYDLAQRLSDLELVESRYEERGLSAHNLYVQVGGQLGVIGLALYLFLVLLAFINAIAAERRFFENGDSTLYAISRSIKIFIIVFMITGITSSGLESKIFWIFAAIGVVLCKLSNMQIDEEEEYSVSVKAKA